MAENGTTDRTNDDSGDSEIREVLARITNIGSLPKPHTQKKIEFKYEPMLLAYLDVLGMRGLLEQAGDDANKVAEVLNVLRELSKPDEGSRDIWKWQFVNFSDLVVRVVPILTEANVEHHLGLVFHEITALCHIQVNAINRGVLIRGALTIGNLSAQDGLMFGPALVRGYELEQRAMFPRIVVDPDVVEALKEFPVLRRHSFAEEMEYLAEVLKADRDGTLYLDYLAYALGNADDHPQYVEFLLKHKAVINDATLALETIPQGTKEYRSRARKVRWMKELHQGHVRSLNAKILKRETGIDRHDLFCGKK